MSNMLRKFWISWLSPCCNQNDENCTRSSVPNEEPTNGLKILRKKTQAQQGGGQEVSLIDLADEIEALTLTSVTSRLKLILEKLESGLLDEIKPEVLKKNIQYAVELLQDGGVGEREKQKHVEDEFEDEAETDTVLTKSSLIFRQESIQRTEESDHELSEVDEEVIPDEVKAWLASTFTRNFPPRTKSTEPRPRFRSVANAIRVGLFVDRFYRQLSSNTLQIPPEVVTLLKDIGNWHFDIYKLHEKSNSHSLKYVVKDLFSRYGILQKFKINLGKLDNYISAIEYGYTKLKNPYHNDIHAADVTQSLHHFIASSGVMNVLTDLEIFALLFAAVIHDFEHTGRTNLFHVNAGTDLALLYNDRAVLENHHASAAFRLLKDEDKNILCNLKPDDFREFRALVIEMVLSTDMSSHFTQLKNIRSMLKETRIGSSSKSTTITTPACCFILHTADISHPGKPWRIHKKLADSILEEFFLQGDEESRLGLPFSPLCDRKSTLVPESQISFIEFIVEPTMTVLGDVIDFLLSESEEGGAKGPEPGKSSKQVVQKYGNRRAESDNQMIGGRGDGGRMLTDGGRTSSFPLQTHDPHSKIMARPWLNHLQENKAKWKMIAAERESKLQQIQQNLEHQQPKKPAPVPLIPCSTTTTTNNTILPSSNPIE